MRSRQSKVTNMLVSGGTLISESKDPITMPPCLQVILLLVVPHSEISVYNGDVTVSVIATQCFYIRFVNCHVLDGDGVHGGVGGVSLSAVPLVDA